MSTTYRTVAALAATALLALGGCESTKQDHIPVLPNPPTTEESAKSTKSTGKTYGSGVYKVGKDIQPGDYTTIAPYDALEFCFWARLRDLKGTPESEIDYGYVAAGTRAQVTVKESDAGIEFLYSCEWTRVDR